MILPLALPFALPAFIDGERPAPYVPEIRFEAPAFALAQPNWRPWDVPADPRSKRKSVVQKKSQMPSATVEVVDETADRAKRLLEFSSRMVPQLRLAYDIGYASRTNKRMLAEFMMMDPSHPHPPTIPSVFYNNFKPPPENPALKEMKQ